MPIDAPIGTLQTFGAIGGFTVKTIRRSTVIGDFTQRKTVLAVTLSKGSTVYEAGSYEDDYFNPGPADAVARALITAFASIGGQVSLGDPGQSPVTPSSASSTAPAPISRSVILTPGTPLPAGRAVIVKGSGSFVLKLAGGGTVTVNDQTGGAGQRHDYAVVDADLANAGASPSVSILY